MSPPVYQNSTYNPDNLESDCSSIRKSFGSLTIYQDETALSNRGIITSSKVRPDWIEITGAEAVLRDTLIKFATRGTQLKAEEVTFHGFDDALGGKIVRNGPFKGALNLGATVSNIRVMVLAKMPNSSNDVLNLSPKSVTGMLRDGGYVVTNTIQPVNEFENVTATGNADFGYAYVLYDRSKAAFTAISGPTASSPEYISKSFSVSFIWLGNMFNASAAALGTAGNSVVLKNYDGFEISPQVGSSLQPFMNPCALRDDVALKLVQQVQHAAPDMLPAAANSWGALLSAAAAAAPAVIDWFSNVFKKKETPKSSDEPMKKKTPTAVPCRWKNCWICGWEA
jgi:hypothetical protein